MRVRWSGSSRWRWRGWWHLRAVALLFAVLGVTMLGVAACGTNEVDSPPPTPATTPAPTATPESSVVYVALGASDAVGVGADDPNTQGYVPLLIARLPTGPRPPLNLGISGAELHDALTQELPQAVAYQPTLVTVWLAANDFKACVPLAQYNADLNKLLQTLQQRTHAQVFVANLPDMALLPAIRQNAAVAAPCLVGVSSAQIETRTQQWNSAIAADVAAHGAVLVNLYDGGLAQHPDYISSADGFHPSTAGYKALADLFWQQITAHHAVPAHY